MDKNENIENRVAKYYDERSKQYLNFKAAGQWKNQDEIPLICDEIIKKTSIGSGDTVLEIGCGNGILGKIINKICQNYVGFDISLGMLKNFKINELCTNFNIFHSSSDHMPFKENSFDKIIINSVTMYMDEEILKNTLKEIETILKPNGLLFIGDNVTESNWIWELSWYRKMPKSLRILLKPYIIFRKRISKIFPSISGKWNSLYFEVSKKLFLSLISNNTIIQETESSSITVRKRLNKNYDGNKRRDFIIKINK